MEALQSSELSASSEALLEPWKFVIWSNIRSVIVLPKTTTTPLILSRSGICKDVFCLSYNPISLIILCFGVFILVMILVVHFVYT